MRTHWPVNVFIAIFLIASSIASNAETIAITSKYKQSISVKTCGKDSYRGVFYFYINDRRRTFDYGVPDPAQPDGVRIVGTDIYFTKKNKYSYGLPLATGFIQRWAGDVCRSRVQTTSIPSSLIVNIKLNKKRTAAKMAGTVTFRAYDYRKGKLVSGVYNYESKGSVTITP